MKYLRAASPRAKCTSDEPCTRVLSTSKNAAAVRSGGGAARVGVASPRSVTAARALASPASCCSSASTRGSSITSASDTNSTLSHSAAILAVQWTGGGVADARGCTICTGGRDRLAELADELGFELMITDVDAAAAAGDPALRAEFGDRLPVVLLDGAEHSYWEVDEPRLRADLASGVR